MDEVVTKIKLDRDLRPTHVYHYAVFGRGEFPYDMLRYDACWFRKQEDVLHMDTVGEERLIKVTGYREPTIARWKSFGWLVKKG